MNPRDFKLYKNQSALMQGLLISFTHGFRWWTCGTLPPLKVLAFVQKMHKEFGILDTPMRRSRRKLGGGVGVKLLVHPSGDGSRFNFWLLATDELPNQKMRDGYDIESKNRLKFEDKYELVEVPKPKEGVTWTWKFQKEYARDWEHRIIDLARHSRVSDLQGALAALKAIPRWNGIRTNVWKCIQKGKKIWMLNHMSGEAQKLRESVVFPTAKDLPPYRRSAAFADPPMTLGIWLDAYQLRLKSVVFDQSVEDQ